MTLKRPLITCIISLSILFTTAQNTRITGTILDAKTKETIVGAAVVLKGTTQGAITDFDGKFEIKQIPPGTYTLSASFVSYKTLEITPVKVMAEKTTTVDIELTEQSIQLEGIEVIATRRTDTDVSLMSSLKASQLIATGVSAQQIAKTQDRDASEVVKRVPGVTIVDNRHIVVRGLNERYNVVWLNNASTPSSESDVKAFSFDVIPSAMLEKLVVYKTPAPELPGDFAGGAIQIFTKNTLENNFLSVSFSSSFRDGTTNKNFYSTSQSKTDWLGYDDGSRKLPSNFPSYKDMIALVNSTNSNDKAYVESLGRAMNKEWIAQQSTATPDLRFSMAGGKIFKLKNSTLTQITSLNYSNTKSNQTVFRANYQNYDLIKDQRDTAYYFNDNQYATTSKVGIMHNWGWRINGHNKLEFRNLLNQIGSNKTTFRNGHDFYGGNTIHAYEFRYQSRLTYSGQIGGEHLFGDDISKLDWTVGYAKANKKEPDVKRLTQLKITEDPDDIRYGMYATQIPFAATPEMTGRLYVDMVENMYNAVGNYEHKLVIGPIMPDIKIGFYIESKDRVFNTRNIGYKIAKTSTYNWEIPFLPIDSLFLDTNINNTNGIKIDEKTNASDSYNAQNLLLAGYISLKIPLTEKLHGYTGIRLEKNKQTLNSYQLDNPSLPVNIQNDTINWLPSTTLAYHLTKKTIFRLGYGLTINRPEFREIAPLLFYDFELKAGVRGNPNLKNAYIHNYDLRYEYYPTSSESFLIGAFYKKFISPIESTVIPTGSGIDYSFTNADKAINYGVEIEARKSLYNLSQSYTPLSFLKNIQLITNASFIKSEVIFEDKSLEVNRPLQGQSPYIINAGIFYQNDSINLSISLLYNIIGKRIMTVGNPFENAADIYEMPRNLLDLTLTKKLGKHLQIKGSIQDILNNKHIFRQFIQVELDENNDKITDKTVERIQEMKYYTPGTYYTLGLTWNI